MSSLRLFSCTLLRDYPSEDLWAEYQVFGQCLPCGRIVLSEYCEKDGKRLGAIFEENAQVGFHFSAEEGVEIELRRLPKFDRVYGKPGVWCQIKE